MMQLVEKLFVLHETCGKLRLFLILYTYSCLKCVYKYTFVLHKGVENFVINV